MKKILYILSLVGVLSFSGCSDMLDTDPTNRVSGTAISQMLKNSLAAINGIYRLMYTGGWGTAWAAENGGLSAYTLVLILWQKTM